jgi:hypothetical protein
LRSPLPDHQVVRRQRLLARRLRYAPPAGLARSTGSVRDVPSSRLQNTAGCPAYRWPRSQAGTAYENKPTGGVPVWMLNVQRAEEGTTTVSSLREPGLLSVGGSYSIRPRDETCRIPCQAARPAAPGRFAQLTDVAWVKHSPDGEPFGLRSDLSKYCGLARSLVPRAAETIRRHLRVRIGQVEDADAGSRAQTSLRARYRPAFSPAHHRTPSFQVQRIRRKREKVAVREKLICFDPDRRGSALRNCGGRSGGMQSEAPGFAVSRRQMCRGEGLRAISFDRT